MSAFSCILFRNLVFLALSFSVLHYFSSDASCVLVQRDCPSADLPLWHCQPEVGT